MIDRIIKMLKHRGHECNWDTISPSDWYGVLPNWVRIQCKQCDALFEIEWVVSGALVWVSNAYPAPPTSLPGGPFHFSWDLYWASAASPRVPSCHLSCREMVIQSVI
jgi:hypothetical protein